MTPYLQGQILRKWIFKNDMSNRAKVNLITNYRMMEYQLAKRTISGTSSECQNISIVDDYHRKALNTNIF